MLVTLLLGLLLASPDGAQPPPSDADLARRAADAFAEGVRQRDDPDEAAPHFRRAADDYEELRHRGVRNPALFRNQGHACLLAGDLPGAILAYRRGLRLAPHDGELSAALAHAREQVAYTPSSRLGRQREDVWPPGLLRWAPRLGLGLALALYALGWVGLTRWRMTRRRGLLLGGIAALLLAVLAGSVPAVVWGADLWQDRQQTHHPLAVIADDGVLLRKGNGFGYPPTHATPVNAGVEARLLFARGDWLQIELAGGESGWVHRDYVLLDTP